MFTQQERYHLRDYHTRFADRCACCLQAWPCRTLRLLKALEEAEAALELVSEARELQRGGESQGT